MTTQNSLVLNAAVAANRLGLSVSTLAKMRLYGTGPTYSKLGRRVVYRPEDLNIWITENQFQSTSEYPQDDADINPKGPVRSSASEQVK